MSETIPQLYFRVRENGAAVFKVDTENKQRRMELDQIAVINIRNGEIKPHGKTDLTQDQIAIIRDWIAHRDALLKHREVDDILRTVDHLNLTAQWVQSKATADQLEDVTDALLMAMYDLRGVLVRKKADRMLKDKSQNP
ncbi:hypothetical protein [Parasulfitobacter algicola]|uniref:Uncharacterized protein n=1 Tax=Parasulfitobacter algicola TaxID=2614809 RepID=A0ABX2IN58_9RHOB|nr:hypothetical protein [Sulfitobacter algicola]NSX54312.1 hypothetical protein [Sulfitobacter algicola]